MAGRRPRLPVESLSQGVWMFDARYRTTFVNGALSALLGYPAEELVGTRLADHFVDGKELPSQGQVDRVLRRKDGSRLTARLSISWSRSTGTALVTDVSDLIRTRDEAVEASRLKSQFLANTSHEIRTPMTVILGMNELLLDTGLDETQQRFAEAVRRAGNGLLAIINDILDFSKIEAGRLELETADVDVRALLDDVVSFLAGPAQAKGLRLSAECDPEVPGAFLGDPTRLRQILLNLAANAVKFTESGSVVLRARVVTAGDASLVRVEVTDTGIGIAAEQQALLFRPFSQADASTTRRFGGTGLGLAIAAQLVDAMGGRLGLQSTVGRGSTFWFEVPCEHVLALPRTGR